MRCCFSRHWPGGGAPRAVVPGPVPNANARICSRRGPPLLPWVLGSTTSTKPTLAVGGGALRSFTVGLVPDYAHFSHAGGRDTAPHSSHCGFRARLPTPTPHWRQGGRPHRWKRARVRAQNPRWERLGRRWERSGRRSRSTHQPTHPTEGMHGQFWVFGTVEQTTQREGRT